MVVRDWFRASFSLFPEKLYLTLAERVLPGFREVTIGGKFGIFIIVSAAEIYLRFKDYGSVLAELMLKTDTESVALSEVVAVAITRILAEVLRSSVFIYESVAAVKIGNLIAFFQYGVAASAVEVISGQVHISIQKSESSVHATHPGSGDAVTLSPASTATAHSAASHRTHH